MKVKLSTKLVVTFLVVGVIPLVALSIVSVIITSNALQQAASQQLISIRDTKAHAIKNYYKDREKQILTFSENRMVIDAMKDLSRSFHTVATENQVDDVQYTAVRKSVMDYYTNQFGRQYTTTNNGTTPNVQKILDSLDFESILLQYYYISNNPHPLGSKHFLDRSDDSSEYSRFHAIYHPVIKDYLKQFGYYDIFLAEPNGKIIYSVFKELDFTTSLKDGPYAQTNFGRAFRKALAEGTSGNSDAVVLVDWAPYFPSYEAPAGFTASPIMENGKLLGIALMQLPLNNPIMEERSGMGESGESFLVGPDHLMRSDSYRFPKTHTAVASFAHPETGKVETKTVEEALKGNSGVEVIKGLFGREVFSAYAPIKIGESQWAIMAEIDKKEALEHASDIRWTAWTSCIIAIIAIATVALWTSRSITGSIQRTINSLSLGSERITEASSQVAGSAMGLASSASEQAATIEEISASLEEMSSVTEQNAERAKHTNSLSGETKNTVQQGLQCMNELNGDVEIIRNSTQQMTDAMNQIKESTDAISKVNKTIDEIAFQTNILALNAAVEAARAGEAGMGFAVVADEVRALAQRSAESAKETASLIEDAIGKSTGGVTVCQQVNDNLQLIVKKSSQVSSNLDTIAGKVTSVDNHANEITCASEEQAQGINQINKAVSDLDETTQKNAASAEESASASEELKSLAQDLKNEINALQAIVSGISRNLPTPQNTPPSAPPAATNGKPPVAQLPLPQDRFDESSLAESFR